MGSLKWFRDLAERRLGPDPSLSPVQAVDFLTYDFLKEVKEGLEVEFLTFVIAVVSSNTCIVTIICLFCYFWSL